MTKLGWLRRLSQQNAPAPSPGVPPGQRIYAIGDIHGRADLLAGLLERIDKDLGEAPAARVNTLVFLGDYVDRGFDSPKVIELLLGLDLPRTEAVFLKGNHEDVFLKFLRDVSYGPGWFAIGGDATVLSYDIQIPPDHLGPKKFAYAQSELRKTLPWRHIEFLIGLEMSYSAGDYFFVHAGVRPEVPLGEQASTDLLWIRDDFLRWQGTFEKVVVHGHSLNHEPMVETYRIGIDTGAYATNLLTCLVLEGESRRFLTMKL